MGERAGRLLAVVAGLWAGVLLAIALIGAPAGFAVLAERAEAGRVAGHMFVREAYLSLALATVLFILERGRARHAAEAGAGSVLNTEMLLLAGVLFCTVAGYFALQPMMAAARVGQGSLSFGALHAISTVFYGLKTLLVLALAWRLSGRFSQPRAS